MRVYNLACHNEHAFEGWFSSHADYESQHLNGQIQCPVCESASIEKRLHAPAILRGGVTRTSEQLITSAEAAAAQSAAQQFADASSAPSVPVDAKQRMVRQALRTAIKANTVDVGDQFAKEVRAMHYGEKPAKTIRGVATPAEVDALADEGIDVMAIPFELQTPELH